VIRWPLGVEAVEDKGTGTLVYRFEGELLGIEDLIDRIVARWLDKMKTGLFNQYK
jgi:hypothetical protein